MTNIMALGRPLHLENIFPKQITELIVNFRYRLGDLEFNPPLDLVSEIMSGNLIIPQSTLTLMRKLYVFRYYKESTKKEKFEGFLNQLITVTTVIGLIIYTCERRRDLRMSLQTESAIFEFLEAYRHYFFKKIAELNPDPHRSEIQTLVNLNKLILRLSSLELIRSNVDILEVQEA